MTNQLQLFNNKKYLFKSIYRFCMYIVLFIMVIGCSSDDDGVALSTEKEITAFVFEASKNTALEMDIVALLNQDKKTITATVPFNTDITALTATLNYSPKAIVMPNTKQAHDFSNPVIYTVTAEDKTKLTYTVIINRTEPSSDREVLIALFNANPDNTLSWNLNDDTMNSWEGVVYKEGRVTSLNLSNKNISTIPASFGYLEGLTFINLNHNNLISIPIEIGKLTKLTVLNLSENDLINLPKEIGKLTKLTALNLYSNGLTSIPIEIGNLVNLKMLYLKLNRLTSIPVEIGNLTQLTALNLSSTSLTDIPVEIGNLTNLTTLSIGYNRGLTSIPKEIGNLTQLIMINAYGSGLTTIPKEIGGLTHLTSLSLGSNALTSIPVEIGDLTNLDYLALTDNRLTNIPKSVCNLETKHGTTIVKDKGVNCI
ncbi:leucine-rich repeat domain-containing protein [Aquimarina longa]|uniref:leucine-rich repeat domain-containing protein n=1 Tax=Aquimarina longa TaxID=1080221 RepID=UPI000AB75253|nr:leucine-rich repeat domain-containing protein [Aquimarina longa]